MIKTLHGSGVMGIRNKSGFVLAERSISILYASEFAKGNLHGGRRVKIGYVAKEPEDKPVTTTPLELLLTFDEYG